MFCPYNPDLRPYPVGASMNDQPILLALMALALVFGGLGIITRKKGFQSIPEFFLASRSVRPSLVTSLLVSGSFSLSV